MNIQITPYADELVLRLDTFPQAIRAEIKRKFRLLFTKIEEDLFSKNPGRFLDQNYIKSGTTDIASATIGYIEVEDKPGVYSILPTKARVLRFIAKSGELVFTRRVYNHPFLKASPIVARKLEEAKPWIVDQLEEAATLAIFRHQRRR